MPSSRVTVFGHGACRLPSRPAREAAAASISWSTFAIHAVTSASFVLPCSIAITTSARTHGRECRLPRRFRGSGRAAKQSRTLPPHASASAAACRSSARRAPSASARSRSSSARSRSRRCAASRSCSSRRRCRSRPLRSPRRPPGPPPPPPRPPPLPGLPVLRLPPAVPLPLLPFPAPAPCLLPPGGPADDLLRPRDHRLGISEQRHARLVTQRGLRQVKRFENPFVLSGTPLPRPRSNQIAAKYLTAGNRRLRGHHPPPGHCR